MRVPGSVEGCMMHKNVRQREVVKNYPVVKNDPGRQG